MKTQLMHIRLQEIRTFEDGHRERLSVWRVGIENPFPVVDKVQINGY